MPFFNLRSTCFLKIIYCVLHFMLNASTHTKFVASQRLGIKEAINVERQPVEANPESVKSCDTNIDKIAQLLAISETAKIDE